MRIDELTGNMKIVQELCDDDERCCSDDHLLTWAFWALELDNEALFEMTLDEYRGCTPAESITRARRKLQENGLCLASSDVAQSRSDCAGEVRESIREMPPPPPESYADRVKREQQEQKAQFLF